MATLAPVPYSPSTMNIPSENRTCGGCHKSVDVDTGGVVVAFGNSLWHVDCFKCAKCGNLVSADTNLLLLSDGSPVCTSCTYNCAVCKNPISDEAIMTGDESYHAGCFTCKTCGRHIGELVFAKTTQGIYCMACHNERVARSRRHAEHRRNRSKTRRDGHRDKERLQEGPSRLQLRENSSNALDAHSPPDTPGPLSPDGNHDAAVSYATKRLSTLSITTTLQDSLHHAKSFQPDALARRQPSPTSANSQPSPTITTSLFSSDVSSPYAPRPVPASGATPLEPLRTLRMPSDGGDSQANSLLSPELLTPQSRPSSRAGRTSRADKRSSINPAVRFEWTNQVSSDMPLEDSPTALSPGEDKTFREQSHHYPNGAQSSDEHSLSPISKDQRRGSPPSTNDSFYSPPSSPSDLGLSYSLASSEPSHTTSKEGRKKHTHQDQDGSLLHHKRSNQILDSGQASPTIIVNATIDSPETSVILQDQTPVKHFSEFAMSMGSDTTCQETDKEEPRQIVPLALPPISLSESDTNFDDLLKFGSKEPMRQSSENLAEKPQVDGSPVLNDTIDASVVPPANGTSSAVDSSSPMPKRSLPPLNNPPKRTASLARKFSSRKPAPKAIILPDNLGANLTVDLEVASNQPSPARFDARKVSENASKSTRRPASAGSGATPTSPRQATARRSSDNTQHGSSLGSIASPTQANSKHVTIVENQQVQARPSKQVATELVMRRIKEALANAQGSGTSSVHLDREFLEIIHLTVQSNHEKMQEMRAKVDRMRRTSQQVIDGLSVAQDEYDKELAARRDAEAEVTRLKVQLSGQAARLTMLSAEDRKREVGEQMSRDLSANLDDLERDLSRIMAERDLAVAEVEELTASKTTANQSDGGLQRSLTHRFDSLKNQYKRDLEPLLRQKETLVREINELKEQRNICLEEATALNARNEELVALNAQTMQQIESIGHMRSWSSAPTAINTQTSQQLYSPSTPRMAPMPPHPAPFGSVSTIWQDERDEPKATTLNEKKMKWFKANREPMKQLNDAHPYSPDGMKHNFQQLTVLRVARCDHCGEKMWGTQLRCTMCNFGCHNRCVGQVVLWCTVLDLKPRDDSGAPLQPSMFGRDLIEQVRAESVREHRDVPIIVEKCVEAVERLAMDYEGIYRKTGGNNLSKVITQLFLRGNYETVDLCDPDTFNDVSSITSVLKTYFRQLPNSLLTSTLYDAFISGAIIRDPRGKADSLRSLVYQLPSEHFHTLRFFILHLHRVHLRASENLMSARNLGVIFGPTLMRPSDPNREFLDMAEKALAIEWLIENATTVFQEDS